MYNTQDQTREQASELPRAALDQPVSRKFDPVPKSDPQAQDLKL